MPQSTSCTAKTPEKSGESQPQEGAKKPACKACCACPETKRVRDDCIVQFGEENCQQLIEKHRECMRQMGFNI
ncbi:Cytochrome c oxidase copper chaperone [Orchesella cincta]|uniref:Cytochrome c oxidase copper chaperone n=1 Tax=Orchesella cincta TaxID=48709 RepID=A0A1D2N9H6_ORCCI|nr:Cytochrome c oxidase copper chaperone [Orchesella cincta]